MGRGLLTAVSCLAGRLSSASDSLSDVLERDLAGDLGGCGDLEGAEDGLLREMGELVWGFGEDSGLELFSLSSSEDERSEPKTCSISDNDSDIFSARLRVKDVVEKGECANLDKGNAGSLCDMMKCKSVQFPPSSTSQCVIQT